MLAGPLATQAFDRRLMSRQLRGLIAGLIVLAAALVAVLGVHYAGSSAAGRIDRAVDTRVIAHLGAHQLNARRLADLGDPLPIFLVVLALVAGSVLLGRPRGALLAVAAPAVAIPITEWILKPLVDRTYTGALSFPSGHATASCTVAFVLVVLMLDHRPPRLPGWLRVVGSLVTLGVACMVSVALVGAHYHYATDTLGGAGVALASVLTVGLIIDAVLDRVSPVRPRSQAGSVGRPG